MGEKEQEREENQQKKSEKEQKKRAFGDSLVRESGKPAEGKYSRKQ